MIHTNENLSARSDDYISKLVGIIELNKAGHKAEMWQMQTFKDYCSEPALIMPIQIRNRISLIPQSAGYLGANLSDHKNPLRAICHAYILMNQVNA